MRTINSNPISSGSIQADFPSFSKPEDGDWTVTVSLRATSAGAGDATIIVLQRGQILATRTVTPTTEFAPYSVTFTPVEAITGLCNVNGPTVIVTGTTGCCSEIPMPDTLHFTLSNRGGTIPDCTCIATSGVLTRITGTNAWVNPSVAAGDCGQTLGITVQCINDQWSLSLSGCGTAFVDNQSVSCDGFEMQIDNLNGDTKNCCDQSNPDSMFKVVVTL